MRKPEPEAGDRTPLRVLYLDCSIGFGGATKSLALVLRALPGVEALILTSQSDDIVATGYGSCRTMRFRRVFNYRSRERYAAWVRRRAPFAWLRWLLLQAYARADDVVALAGCVRMVWLLRRRRCDLIHLNNYFQPPEAIVAARIAGVPLVAHVRGFWMSEHRLSSRLAPSACRVIAVSDAVAASLPPDIVPRERVVTIYDPVDPAAFDAGRLKRDGTRHDWRIPPDAVAFGIFGRVVPWKGQLEFVHALLRAMDQSPVAWGVIVGDESDGAREYFTRVRDLIQSSPHRDRFALPGYQEDVERWYWSVDVVVHASIEPEPFGMVVPEGMMACRPVIAANAGGPKEMVTDGLDGLLVPPGDIGAMAQAMLDLAGDSEKRQRMGAKGHSKVCEALSISAVAARVRSVYDVVLDAGRPRADAGAGGKTT